MRQIDFSLFLFYFYKLAYISLINYDLMLVVQRAQLHRDINLRFLSILVILWINI